MSAFREKLAQHKVVTFCVITFVLSWGFWFATIYPSAIPALQAGENPLDSIILMSCVAAGMIFPALSVVLTRLLTGEGFKNAWIVPRQFKRTWKYYVVAWFGPLILIVFGAAVYFIIFPSNFDPSFQSMVNIYTEQARAYGQQITMSTEEVKLVGFAQMGLMLIAPLANFVACFGEEWGWRGYLLPHLMEKYTPNKAIVISGVIWGLWHAPITTLGHNYGLGYPGWPFLGIVAMCCFCVIMAFFLSWMTLRAKSCVPAVLAHGMLNGAASFPIMFASSYNAFIGPAPTGIIGGIGFIIVAVACYVSLKCKG